MTERKDGKFWRQQVDKALEVRRLHEPWWDANLTDYAPGPNQTPEAYTAQINSNRDFTLVERKKADLFFQKPEVTLQPTPLMEGPIVDPTTQQPLMGPPDPQTGQQQPILASVALQVHQELVNEKLGPDGIDATRLAHQAIFDMLALSGVGWTKLGYEQVARPVETLDPMTGEPRSVEVPVKSHCYWEYFSPKQSLVPHGFRRTEWDKAPWLGHQFELPLTEGNRRKYRLPEDFEGSKSDAKQRFDHGAGSAEAADAVFTGVELWYRSVLYRDDVFDPDHLTHLVLVDGLEDAIALEEDCPEQTLDETGKLTADSLVGFPIHPLNARTLTDSAYPPADATVTRPLVRELNISREQNIMFRDSMTLRFQANGDVLPKDALSKIVRSPIGGVIVVPGEAFHGEGAIKELPQGSMPRENFSIQEVIDNDIARSWALDAGQQGVQSASTQTATAEQIQQANANARLDWERGIVLSWYCKGVTKLSTYLLRYLTVEQAAALVGPQRAMIWDAWRKTGINSAVAFTAMPDSALRVDQAVDRKAAQELYSFLANDPYVAKGRAKLLEKLLRKFHIDPAGIVSPPDPPKPEPPKLALSFKGEDLIGPQAPIVLEILAQQGIQVSPGAVALSQGMLLQAQQLAAAEAAEQEAQGGDTKHGGKVAQQESLSKHAADQTGGMQNTGMPAAMGAAGGMIQ